MERRFAALLFIFALGLGVYACSPDTRDDPLGSSSGASGGGGGGGGGAPTPTPVLPTYALLTNGLPGVWATLPLTIEVTSPGTLSAGAVDPISGMTSSQVTVPSVNAGAGINTFTATPFLRLTTCPLLTGNCPSLPLPAGYLPRGRIEFDLRVDVPLNQVQNVLVSWGNGFCATHGYSLAPSLLSNANFVHYSLPLSGFSGSGQPCNKALTTAVEFDVLRISPASTNAGLSVANVQWVAP